MNGWIVFRLVLGKQHFGIDLLRDQTEFDLDLYVLLTVNDKLLNLTLIHYELVINR